MSNRMIRFSVIGLAVVALATPQARAETSVPTAASAEVVPPSDPAVDPQVQRLAGADRYATAARIAGTWPVGQEVVYVAAGVDFPDAVVAAAAAGADQAPVLLVKQAAVPSETRRALARLEPTRIEVIGDTSQLGEDVLVTLDGLAGADGAVRIAGSDAYGTSAAVSARHPAGGGAVYLASGESYADTLTAAALAGEQDRPLLLTRPGDLPTTVAAELARLDPSEVIVIGGDSAVSAGVESSAGQAADAPTRRLGGQHRFATALEVSREFSTGTLPAVIASGRTFPDALVGGALAARLGAPVILTDTGSLPADGAHGLLRQESDSLYVLGGRTVLTEPAVTASVDVIGSRSVPGWGVPEWRDEFSGTSVDTDRWRVRDNDYVGYDRSLILADAVTVADGLLKIRMEELPEPVVRGGQTRYWSTGYLDTIGKAQARYGRWEFRAKLPTEEGASRGVWPAFWLRNDGNVGEIDLMEAWGGPTVRDRAAQWHNSSTFSVHESTSGGLRKDNWVLENQLAPGEGPYDTPTDFQVWTLEYTPDSLKGYLNGELAVHIVPDGELVSGEQADYSWVWGPTFQPDPWAIRLNMQMSDSYWSPGIVPSELSAMPADYEVDYVRFWAYQE